MELDDGSPSENKEKDCSEWKQLSFKDFIGEGSQKMIESIIAKVDNVSGRLKEMVDCPIMEKSDNHRA
ncbi:hypothetical protein KAR91_33940 [Candidatus Pacearchaeota archaeon]|nr:hypothetical protein [Candidatus Pacearchaeota archaeon]